LKQRRRENGEIAARKAGSTPPSKWKPHAERIEAAVRDRPDATLAELREQLGLDMSLATLTRALRALQLTFKKKSFMRRNKIARTSRHSGFIGKPK
jgi:transposase